jgi:hypothetical protein
VKPRPSSPLKLQILVYSNTQDTSTHELIELLNDSECER